jgi:multidrug efflux pump subunit AcrA (membrane-fusion protein)
VGLRNRRLTDTLTSLLTRIDALLDAPPDGDAAPSLDRVERTLTDGYARALEFELESIRIERRIAEVAANDGDPLAKADELAVLSRRLAATAEDLDRLRAILEPLLLHARALRAAAIAAAAS